MPSSNVSPIQKSFAPAGWYRDPLGLPQFRWWNGLSWTNQVEEPSPEMQVSTAYKVELVRSP
ncbi:MAG: hypothetical protein JWL94_255 [Microbacteriaceae bacterium]|jgi:hypothetical protein|nr:hypothetical protein [Microbacteriaceae bacterium]